MLLQQLAVELAGRGLVTQRPLAFGETVEQLVRGNALGAFDGDVLGLGIRILSAIEETVGHRHAV